MGKFRVMLLGIGIAITFALSVSARPAIGGESSYETRATQRIELNDNKFLDPDDRDEVLGTLSSLYASYGKHSPIQYWKFHSSLEYQRYFGSDQAEDINPLSHNHGINYHRQRELFSFDLEATLKVQNAALSELDDTGLTDQDTSRMTLKVDMGGSYQVNPTNKVSLSGSVQNDDFSDSTLLQSFVDVTLGGAWTHQINSISSLSTNVSWSYFSPDNTATTSKEAHTYRALGRYNSKLAEQISIYVGAGVTFRDEAGNATGSNGSDDDVNAQAQFGLNYSAGTTQFSLSASHDLEPSAAGELKQRTRVTFGASERVNNQDSVAIAASYLHQDASGLTGTERDYLSVSPSYTFLLAPRWNGQISYSFRLQDQANEDIAYSNAAYFSLTRKFNKKTCSEACEE